MSRKRFTKECVIHAPSREVFDWHKEDDALEKLIPPWEPVTVKSRTGDVPKDGSRVELSIKIFGPFTMIWESRHQNYMEGRQFQDLQVKGPFDYWVHTHRVESLDDERSRLIDHVEYELPFGWLGDVVMGWYVRSKLEKMFEYRHRVTRRELERPQN